MDSFLAVLGLPCTDVSLVVASKGYSSLQCIGFSLQFLLLFWSTGSPASVAAEQVPVVAAPGL